MNMKVSRSAKIKRIITFLGLVAIFEAGGMATAFLWQHHDGREAAAQAAEVMGKENMPLVRADRAEDEGELFARTAQLAGAGNKQMSVYFLRPDREVEPFIYNQRQMFPASMIKLFVMAKAMQDVHDGRLSLDDQLTIRQKDVVGGAGVTTWYNAGEKRTIAQLIQLMVVESDNTATNMLMDKLGMANINQYLQQHGYKDTVLVQKLMLNKKTSKKNLSSVRDIGHLLTNLYYHQLVGEEEDRFMLEILKQQRDKECFPAAVSGFEIAHKTGEVKDVYADGGIFYGPQEDFILVALSNSNEGRGEVIQKMQKLARYYAETLQ